MLVNAEKGVESCTEFFLYGNIPSKREQAAPETQEKCFISLQTIEVPTGSNQLLDKGPLTLGTELGSHAWQAEEGSK